MKTIRAQNPLAAARRFHRRGMGWASPSVRADSRRPLSDRFLSALCPLSAVLLLLLTGCHHLGPKTVAVDRFDYGTAIPDSSTRSPYL